MDEIRAWIGLDVGKGDHHATVIDPTGAVLFDRGVGNDEQAIERLLDRAGQDAALVIDQPGSIGALAVAVARGAACRSPTCPGWLCAELLSSTPARPRTTGAIAS